jgi:hypothetical protein
VFDGVICSTRRKNSKLESLNFVAVFNFRKSRIILILNSLRDFKKLFETGSNIF